MILKLVTCLKIIENYLKLFEDKESVFHLKNNEVTAFDLLYWKYYSAIYTNVFKLKGSVATLHKPAAGGCLLSYNRTVST